MGSESVSSTPLHGLRITSCVQVPFLFGFLSWLLLDNGQQCGSQIFSPQVSFWSWCSVAAIEALTETAAYLALRDKFNYHLLTDECSCLATCWPTPQFFPLSRYPLSQPRTGAWRRGWFPLWNKQLPAITEHGAHGVCLMELQASSKPLSVHFLSCGLSCWFVLTDLLSHQ